MSSATARQRRRRAGHNRDTGVLGKRGHRLFADLNRDSVPFGGRYRFHTRVHRTASCVTGVPASRCDVKGWRSVFSSTTTNNPFCLDRHTIRRTPTLPLRCLPPRRRAIHPVGQPESALPPRPASAAPISRAPRTRPLAHRPRPLGLAQDAAAEPDQDPPSPSSRPTPRAATRTSPHASGSSSNTVRSARTAAPNSRPAS